MATRTEEYLKALADGGDIPIGCCATNTQKLIADAAERVNALDAEIQKIIDNPGIIDIRSYGAVSGEDSTAAIQNALNAANGLPVYIPAGTYLLSGPISVPDGAALFGDGESSVLKAKDAININNNLLKIESVDNVVLRDFVVDGNRANQDSSQYTQYTIFISGTDGTVLEDIRAYNANGVGIQVYNSTNVSIHGCYGSGCRYHGFECEQDSGCVFDGCFGTDNDRHGIFVSPGEVGGTGSVNNIITNCVFSDNDEYGVALGIDAAGLSIGLSRNNLVSNCQIMRNGYYGVSVYRVDDTTISDNVISDNGAFGIYFYRATRNVASGNRMYHNSTLGAGAYSEIMLEGANDGGASYNNLIVGNYITPQNAPFAINEATSSDGPNFVFNNVVPNPGTVGTVNIQHVNTNYYLPSDNTSARLESYRVFNKGLAIGNTNNALPGGAMGFDSPWTNVLRIYNDVGSTQIVAPNGAADFYVGGNNSFTVTSGGASAQNNKITNVADGTVSSDAVNYGQLTNAISTLRTELGLS